MRRQFVRVFDNWRQLASDPLFWRRIVAGVMLGMAWSFHRAPEAGVAGYLNDLIGFISAHEAAYLLVACGVFILARPDSSLYQLLVLPLVCYVAITWSYLKTLPPNSQTWASFFLYAFAAGVAFWLPVRWPTGVNDAKPLA